MITFSQLGRYGRIANQMFQIAGTIGFAQKYGYGYGFPYWQNYDEKERFSGTDDIDIQKHFKNPLPLMKEHGYKLNNIPWGLHPEHGVSDWDDLKGHMQSEKYFLHCEELIRHYFKFKNETGQRVDTIAVHFRGGDYGGDYHPRCTKEYYEEAMSYFEDTFDVMLFTDDPSGAAEVIPFDFNLVDESDPMKALELMTKCDAHIIANSTFSWWGAWLANSRRVVAPSKWFGPAAKLESKDIYPDKWIVI